MLDTEVLSTTPYNIKLSTLAPLLEECRKNNSDLAGPMRAKGSKSILQHIEDEVHDVQHVKYMGDGDCLTLKGELYFYKGSYTENFAPIRYVESSNKYL